MAVSGIPSGMLLAMTTTSLAAWIVSAATPLGLEKTGSSPSTKSTFASAMVVIASVKL